MLSLLLMMLFELVLKPGQPQPMNQLVKLHRSCCLFSGFLTSLDVYGEFTGSGRGVWVNASSDASTR